MGITISNFILNSDFTSEKVVDISPIVITKSISAGSRTGRQLLGYADATVPLGDYILSCIHSNNYNSGMYSSIYGYYFSKASDAGVSYPFYTFGEIIQMSSTVIRLNVWLDVSGGGSCTVPAFTATARVKLSVLPINW